MMEYDKIRVMIHIFYKIGGGVMRILDISRGMLTAPIYPGDPEPRLQRILKLENGDNCNLSALYFGLHTATHADAQSHFIDGGISIDQMPLANYIGECLVIDIPEGPLPCSFVDRHFPLGCERILMRSHGKSALTESAAYEISARGTRLIGTDALSIAAGGDDDQRKIHRAILGGGTAILEGLNLEKAEPGHYFLFAPPVKIEGVDGAPVRAVLIADYLFWSEHPPGKRP